MRNQYQQAYTFSDPDQPYNFPQTDLGGEKKDF